MRRVSAVLSLATALSELRGGGRFVIAPTPGAAALLGVGGLWALRRRRS